MTIEKHLEDFRVNFPLIRVTVMDDYLIYKTSRGSARRIAQEANELIDAMGLPLVAIPMQSMANDTFHVKNNETPDI